MGKSKPINLVIIGNGITGISAARTVRKLLKDINIQILSDESDYFWSRTALMYIFMGHMKLENTEPYERSFYTKNRLELVRGKVTQIDTAAKQLRLEAGQTMPYDLLLLATGSKPNKFGWPGQDLKQVQGMYSLQDLEQLEQTAKSGIHRGVIIGGGLIGIELAEMLHTRHIPVTFLVREQSYMNHVLPPEESQMINREIRSHGIDLKFNTEMEEILGDDRGAVRAVRTKQGEEIPCNFVGLSAGVSPNLSALEGSSIQIDRGVLVDEQLQTNSPDVFAAGDCAQFRNPDGTPAPRIERIWYTGRDQGESVGRLLAERATEIRDSKKSFDAKPYATGIFSNSAKFFTIEYQIYGDVPRQPEPSQTLYWQHPTQPKAIRLTWDGTGADTVIRGFNLMGIRYRHEVCEAWIREKRSLDYVVTHLPEANFDPEFYEHYENNVQKIYQEKFQTAGKGI